MKACPYKRSSQSGFTLVEIAIVLVIIGLLLGGILKGQEMITQARIKNVINDFNGVTAAVNSYNDRYKALPGDDLNTIARWRACGFTPPGYNTAPAAPSASSPQVGLFWLHLRLAGFAHGEAYRISSTG